MTGGAGFVGTHVAVRRAESGARVISLDNLRRRGSELNLGRLREAGVTFVHGDDSRYVVETNLVNYAQSP